MAHSYSALYYHMVFSTKNRRRWIKPDREARLYGFLGSVLKRRNCRLLSGDGDEDHVHLLASLARDVAPAEILRVLKSTSSGWFKEAFQERFFGWQEGYAAFTVSHSQLPAVTQYIKNQKSHHRRISFEEELAELLDRHGIEYDPKYLL